MFCGNWLFSLFHFLFFLPLLAHWCATLIDWTEWVGGRRVSSSQWKVVGESEGKMGGWQKAPVVNSSSRPSDRSPGPQLLRSSQDMLLLTLIKLQQCQTANTILKSCENPEIRPKDIYCPKWCLELARILLVLPLWWPTWVITLNNQIEHWTQSRLYSANKAHYTHFSQACWTSADSAWLVWHFQQLFINLQGSVRLINELEKLFHQFACNWQQCKEQLCEFNQIPFIHNSNYEQTNLYQPYQIADISV